MSAGGVSLRFVYPPQGYHSDIRTFQVEELIEGSEVAKQRYRFSHPSNGMAIGLTHFEGKKSSSDEWDRIGYIEWTSPLTGTVHFGEEELDIKDVRKIKNSTSTSRRFKYKGVEYKWKVSDKKDLYCIDPQNNTMAKWDQTRHVLRLHTRRVALVEWFVVTCLLNMWFQTKGAW